MGMRIYSDVAIDDFSLSPECFGLNIPTEYLHGYNYWDPRIGINKQSHKDFSLKNSKSFFFYLSNDDYPNGDIVLKTAIFLEI